MPELKPSTGMPAATAFFTVGIRASGVTSVVAMPSTLESMAFWISVGLLGGIGVGRVLQRRPGVLGRLLRTGAIRSQNVSPGVSWVTMAKV